MCVSMLYWTNETYLCIKKYALNTFYSQHCCLKRDYPCLDILTLLSKKRDCIVEGSYTCNVVYRLSNVSKQTLSGHILSQFITDL